MSKEIWEGKTLSIPNSWLIIIVAVICLTSFGFGVRQRYNIPGVSLDEELGLDLTGEEEEFLVEDFVRNQITIDFEIDSSDWQAGGTVTPTTPVYSYFYDLPEDGESGTGITVAGEDITIKASNEGKLWIDVYGGTDFYLVEKAIRDAVPELTSVVINDYDNDDQLDFLVQLDLSDFLMEDFQYKPTFVMELPLLDMDVSGITTDAPADVTGVGTSQATITITWMVTALTAEDGFVLNDLLTKSNDTEKGNDVTFKTLTVSGTDTVLDSTGRVLSGSSLTFTPTTAYIGGSYAAYWTQASDVDEPLDSEALIIYRDTNAGDGLYITLTAQCNFEANDDLLIDIEFSTVDPAGTVVEVTDQVAVAS